MEKNPSCSRLENELNRVSLELYDDKGNLVDLTASRMFLHRVLELAEKVKECETEDDEEGFGIFSRKCFEKVFEARGIGPTAIISTYEKRRKKADEAAAHAVRRLKEKGVIKQGPLNIGNYFMIDDPYLKFVVADCFNADFMRKNVTISDETWMRIAEVTMYLVDKEGFEDKDKKWVVSIMNHLRVFNIVTVLFVHFTIYSYSDNMYQAALQAIKTKLEQANKELSKSRQNKSLKRYKQRAKDNEEKLENLTALYQKEKQKWEKESASLRKQIRTAEHGQQDLVIAQAEEIDELRAQIAELTHEYEDEDEEPAMTAKEEKEEAVLPVLPESGIVFIGGHPVLCGKLRRLHPKWTFYSCGDYVGRTRFAGCKCAFLWTGHMTHALYLQYKKYFPAGQPCLIVQSTNLRKLDIEMRKGYKAALDGDPSACNLRTLPVGSV